MYISNIIGYLTWPAIIILSYWMIRWALKRFEKKLAEDSENQG